MDTASHVKLLLPRQSQTGSHRTGSNSLSGILSTLIPVFVFASIGFVVFLVFRRKIQRVYEPRSLQNLVPQHHEAQRAKGTFFGWIPSMREVKDSQILKQHSLDAFLYLRFLKMLVVIAFVGACMTWPILFPVNATGGGGQSQLDILSFSNVENPNRYYAHALVACVFQAFVVYVITRERSFFIGLRQAYYLSALHALRLSSRTVMFLTLPSHQRTSAKVKEMFPQARKVWMVPNCEDLQDLVDDRDKEWQRLEKAQLQMIQGAHKNASKGKLDRENPLRNVDEPTHRTKPLIGKKVKTITYSRSAMTQMNQDIERAQKELLDGKGEMLSATFIEFENQFEAQKAIQFSFGDKRTEWKPRHIGVQPDEIIWKNLGTSYKTRTIKMLVATIIISLIILFWTLPVAFIGILTNVNALTSEVPFLSFIDNIPDVILGVVTGLLPTILLSVLMALVPIFCRFLAKFAGAETLTEVELKTQNWYFAFQVIQVFLITTFTSGAAAVAANIVQNPPMAVTLLAKNLPKASNFYISYFILYGLMTAMMQFLNLVPFLLFYVLAFLDKTPRKKYNRWLALKGLGWGSIYPQFTNLGVIAISYSCIAPLVLGFATIGFALLYLGFRYNFLFVYGIKVDMKGEPYSRALRQLLTGVYLSTICLIGLFAISVGDSVDAVGPLVIMIIFLIGLILWHVLSDRALAPLEQHLPIYRLEINQYSQQSAKRVEDVEQQDGQGHETSDGQTEKDVHKRDELPAVLTTAGPDLNRTGNFLTRWANPSIDRAFQDQKKLLDSWSGTFDDPTHYDKENVDTAYMHPALQAETKPMVWVPRDQYGVSTIFVEENRQASLQSSDEHAWIDEKGKVQWDHDRVTDCPIYEKPILW